jgi:manganese/zinc/iron transport system permease protein
MLFGNASTLLQRDVLVMALLAAISCALLLACWKQFKLISFDPEFAQTTGLPLRFYDTLLVTLLAVAIVTGLQMVGVVLMSALVIAPAAAARQWSNSLGKVVALASAFGAVGGLAGALLSSGVARLPTGPAIVLVVSALVALSLFLAPARGLLWDWLRHRGQHRRVRAATVLLGLLHLVEDDPQPFRPHDIAALDAIGVHSAAATMPVLEQRGLVRREGRMWALTARGLSEAQRVGAGRGGGL